MATPALLLCTILHRSAGGGRGRNGRGRYRSRGHVSVRGVNAARLNAQGKRAAAITCGSVLAEPKGHPYFGLRAPSFADTRFQGKLVVAPARLAYAWEGGGKAILDEADAPKSEGREKHEEH